MKSNCHLKAWEKLRRDDAQYMCIKFTAFSSLHESSFRWWWKPIKGLGIALQWLIWPLAHIAEILRSGRWYHVTWLTHAGEHWEFTTINNKRMRGIPPIIFRGKEQQVPPNQKEF